MSGVLDGRACDCRRGGYRATRRRRRCRLSLSADGMHDDGDDMLWSRYDDDNGGDTNDTTTSLWWHVGCVIRRRWAAEDFMVPVCWCFVYYVRALEPHLLQGICITWYECVGPIVIYRHMRSVSQWRLDAKEC